MQNGGQAFLRREGTEFIGDAEARVWYSNGGKSVVGDEGRRVLVSRDSRQAKVRRRLMAVKPMTQDEQSVCF